MGEDRTAFWREKSLEGRKLALGAMHAVGNGHVGGVMSVMDLLVVLYYDVMRVNAAKPADPGRDRFVMSKGHAGPALYSVLAMKGYFDRECLPTLNQNGTKFPSHCDMNKVPGVDFTCGSLGQGISAALGMALGAKRDGADLDVYCAVGDGECQEGQVWEAALLASQLELDRFFVFVDNNGGQVDGYTDGIVRVEPLADKWAAFGWDTRSLDGHDHRAILAGIRAAARVKGKPHALILNTVKAKCVINAEGTATCHHMGIDDKVYAAMLAGLEKGGE